MKAIVQEAYGGTEQLQLKELPVPEVADDEVLVKVRASSVHADVWHVVSGRPYAMRLFGAGIFRPRTKVPGIDLAGTVEAVGATVQRFSPGDAVFGESHSGIQWMHGGAWAEYAAVPQSALALKPEGVGFEEAASVAASGYIAVTNLESNGLLVEGRHLLINGAAGMVGTIALQLAKARGLRVTAVDRGDRLALLAQLGADDTLDYTTEDITSGDVKYDVILDVASTLTAAEWRRMLTPDGSYVLIGHDHYGTVGGRWFGNLPGFFAHMFRSLWDRNLPLDTEIPAKDGVMQVLAELLASGALTPVIDKVFPLEQAPEALRYLVSGEARGRIVVVP